MNDIYKRQVRLLLDVLPEVAKEACFAMHGGTAINLFVRDMPRLSVDIDLTYIQIAGRSESLAAINDALLNIKMRIEALRRAIRVEHRPDICKLQLDAGGVLIKIEVNTVGRGLLGESSLRPLCDFAQGEFDAFCVVPIVPLAQLYGGKLCAALDRQHPRDLFDVKLLFDNEGLTRDIRQGLLFSLMASNRPTYELLDPNLLDQRAAYQNQFEGMSAVPFSYEDFELTRTRLISAIRADLTASEKAFLLAFNCLEPDWSEYPWADFPALRWKLQNLAALKERDCDKYVNQLQQLERILRAK
ncbi:nucleotidyl transferase AbiEii/AbiGii toxin family protein [Zhongshania sp. BJYM1]|uniref:nucleotidyl transferase AbiEii/AbiGii toxin family protein n=1 Tax=Zhongshania aquatica TaxID=2965069 RepID=UPI0022B43BE6|nr:nucleotidyl transferase AbiEii/AbiGii toxin family protein [Marortus sp. BJYM1]